MSHDHHGHDHQTDRVSDAGLLWAIVLNAGLTVVEVIAGIFSGSLALIGDAVHNGSDAGSLVVALVARRWSRRQPDEERTFGYRRAAIVGAFINLITLVLIGGYLLVEAVMRLLQPEPIAGWIMIIVAGVALVVDIATVLLMRAMGPGLNIRAALIHNLTDALASVAVILAGAAVLLWGVTWVDPLLTALIAAYILIQSAGMLRTTIAILMDSVPDSLSPTRIAATLSAEDPAIHNVHHVHVRRLDEHYLLMEAHLLVDHASAAELEAIKARAKTLVADRFDIQHTTLELEFRGHACEHGNDLIAQGH